VVITPSRNPRDDARGPRDDDTAACRCDPLPGCQAGHPPDPHYDDQIAPWFAGELDEIDASFAIAPSSVLRLEVLAGSATDGDSQAGAISESSAR
jgi:hypothetical protein